jgi:hypothetical protein
MWRKGELDPARGGLFPPFEAARSRGVRRDVALPAPGGRFSHTCKEGRGLYRPGLEKAEL